MLEGSVRNVHQQCDLGRQPLLADPGATAHSREFESPADRQKFFVSFFQKRNTSFLT
jgi:hypothetical protein